MSQLPKEILEAATKAVKEPNKILIKLLIYIFKASIMGSWRQRNG